MTATVHTLHITPASQDRLAVLLQQLERQNKQAAWRREILEIIEGAESVIAHHECVIMYARSLLSQMDGGPTDAA